MESYGELLKVERERQNIDFSTISKDTYISVNYLKALEEENTDVFQGEPYLVGFLRTYSKYLGLDDEKLVGLYHAKVIQESPVPEGLIVQEPPKYKFPLIYGLVIFLFLALVGTIVFLFVRESKIDKESLQKNVTQKYELTEKPLHTRLHKGDQLVLSSEGKNVVLTVADTVESFVLETPVGRQFIELSDEIELDIDNDKIPDLIAYVSDITPKGGDEKRGAEVRIMLKNASSVAIGETDETAIQSAEEMSDKNKTVICEDTRAYPFTVVATFRGGCVFRYRLDRKETVQDYLASGEEVRMTASNAIRIWMSNGNTVKLEVQAGSKKIDLGVAKAGAVIVEDIKWVKDVDGKYKIVVVDVE